MKFVAALFFCGSVWAADNGMAKQAMTETAQGSAVLLDVRENEEVAQGRVRGSLTFPKSKMKTAEWERFVSTLNKEETIYTYCRSGRRSDEVANELRKRGFRAQNAGSLTQLKAAGAVTQ